MRTLLVIDPYSKTVEDINSDDLCEQLREGYRLGIYDAYIFTYHNHKYTMYCFEDNFIFCPESSEVTTHYAFYFAPLHPRQVFSYGYILAIDADESIAPLTAREVREMVAWTVVLLSPPEAHAHRGTQPDDREPAGAAKALWP
jgi:hypothetical protein